MNRFPKDKFRVRIDRFYRRNNSMYMIIPSHIGEHVWVYPQDPVLRAIFTDEKYAVRASLFPVDSKGSVSNIPVIQTWSRCNKTDQPSRKEGVRLAMERLELAAIGMGLINPIEE